MKAFADAQNYHDLCILECGKEDCIKSKMVLFAKKEYYLFHYVSRGKGTLIIANKEYHLSRGHLFLIPPNTEAVYFPDENDPWSYLWVGFFGPYVNDYLNFIGMDVDHPVIKDNDKVLKQYFDGVTSSFINAGYCGLHALGSLYQLFGELIFQKHGKADISNGQITVQLAKDFIMNNYHFDISIVDIAHNAHVTPNYLSYVFQKEEGMTTKRFLIMVRMEKAMAYLKSNNYKIKEVAEMVGYNNQLYFSNEFKKYYGKSPLAFMNKNKEEEE